MTQRFTKRRASGAASYIGVADLRIAACFALLMVASVTNALAQLQPTVPAEERGRLDAERSGFLDASNIRTVFWNYGMVGDYPADPGNVDLSVFHSVEVPKGSGMNYSDGITPFVLAKITQRNGSEAYIMETGFRERQGNSPYFNRQMRFEPRPGYFQDDPLVNAGRSPAISNDPRTWPASWPDKRDDVDDPGWQGSWNGYFGKQLVADQECYMVLDDQFYDAWDFQPDERDPTRKGLGLRIEARGFQWANPQARNVIFWHYDITNEGTTDYDDNIIFGLYMDSGVGGSALSCDGIFESDDDNAFFNRTFDDDVINLVYTWDNGGHGRDLGGFCGRTGYLGYAYLETPGNALDGVDNDEDGITDEVRDGGPGQHIVGQDAIRAYVLANYDLGLFENEYGALEDHAPFRAEEWWTGDEDMDWVAELHDTGADGVFETNDEGELDGMPTAGEPSFDRTDLHESDQIGLTGFKINRIRAGVGNPNQQIDDILFFTNFHNWPQRLYEQFSDPDPDVRFDVPLASNYNIGFLFASGPFKLPAGKTERFSLALAYGADLNELRRTVQTVQQIYDANYRFAVPPKAPTVTAEAGDGFVRLSWNDVAERSADPVTGEFDFEGYRIYRATDPEFRDPQVVSTARGTGPIGNGRPIAQFDLVDDRSGFSEQVVEGVAYYLGDETGITHTWTDDTVTNGQLYYYAVCAYDYGSDRLNFYPSENAIAVSRTSRGGLVLPSNVVAMRPNPKVPGYVAANTASIEHVTGGGAGTVTIEVLNSDIVPDGHRFAIRFANDDPDAIRAATYSLTDLTTPLPTPLFEHGTDFDGTGIGPVGSGFLPRITTQATVEVDDSQTGFADGGSTNVALTVVYQPVISIDRRRPGFPDDITVRFDDDFIDTSIAIFPVPARPAKFTVMAHTPRGDERLDFRFLDSDLDGTLSTVNEYLDIVTYTDDNPATPLVTWRLRIDSAALGGEPIEPPGSSDVFQVRLTQPFGAADAFEFTSRAQRVDADVARAQGNLEPYVVPNPYVGSASFEPERFAISGRGERRLEFRNIPLNSTVRIYSVRGELVQTLWQDGSNDGFVPWNLRTKDNLDVAPGLYIFHVDAGKLGRSIGKFAIVK